MMRQRALLTRPTHQGWHVVLTHRLALATTL